MTPEERIARLEAEVRSLRLIAEGQAAALRAANERLKQEGDASALLAERRETARLKKRRQRAEREAAFALSRDSGSVLSPGQCRDNAGTTLPPPLEGSPPPSVPSSPSPISSPQPLFAPVASAPSQAELVKSPKRSTAAEEFRDWARAESRKLLPPDAPDNCTGGGGMWPRLGKALKEQGMAKMQAAFRLFLTDAYWKAQGLPLSGFVAKWEQFAGRVTATSQQTPSGLLPKADDPEWVTV